MSDHIEKWSHSLLTVYRSCHYWAKLKYIDHSPEPPRDEKAANTRGTQRHKLAEDFILADDAPFPNDLVKFDGPLIDVRNIRRDGLGTVEVERKFYLDHNWKPCEEKDRWLVVIPDIKVVVPGEINLTIDNKTGKKYGNELKHYGQCELYSITAMLHDPGYESYEAELWYLDLPDTWQITFLPEKLEKAQVKLDNEVQKMMEDRYFRPSPSKLTCRWCPYSPQGTGVCPVGVTK